LEKIVLQMLSQLVSSMGQMDVRWVRVTETIQIRE
jgi:hypothetical protein